MIKYKIVKKGSWGEVIETVEDNLEYHEAAIQKPARHYPYYYTIEFDKDNT